MIFSSVTFLFYFLPLFLFAYFITPFKNTILLVASLLFYAWGEAGYTLLLLVSIVSNYLFGRLIGQNNHKTNKKTKGQKLILSVGIAVNVLLIAYFKYFNFVIQNLFSLEHVTEVHLPLGISFFTFQAISYLVDVYRKEAHVEKNIFNLALYISMFPQLIAGPIVRFKTVAKQIHHRVSSLNNVSKGMRFFIVGLAQKVLIANTVAITADEIFKLHAPHLTTAVAWLGAICYSFQIYFDFAGYSNMAIGLGLVMGFSFPKNFNYPYISRSITEFWQRWHISLSTWFRDYLYIPLGGNRLSPIRTYMNLMLVFLLCGFWHGAAWTFIIWGIYHGFFLILERIKLKAILLKLWRPINHVYSLIVVMVGWVIFRAKDIDHILYYMKSLFGASVSKTEVYTLPLFLTNSLVTTLIIAVLFSLPVFSFIQKHLKRATRLIITELFYLIILLLSLITIASGSYNPFIYFRF